MKLIPSFRNARLVAALALAFTSVPTFAVIPPAEKILPADTLAVFCVPDCNKLSAVYKKSPQTQMWHDPAMKAFKDKFMNKWDTEVVKPLEKEMGIKFADYQVLAQGVMTLAVTQEGWDAKSDKLPGFVMLLDARDKSEQLKKNLADLRKRWVDGGKSLRTQKIRDVEFSIITLTSNDLPKSLKKYLPSQPEVQEIGKDAPKTAKAKDEIIVGQFESLLIVSSTTAVAEKIMTRLTGGTLPALADDANFEANRAAVFRDASLYGWFNVKRLMDVLVKIEPPKADPDAPSMFPALDPAKILKTLGLASMTSVALSYRDTPEGGLADVFVGAPEATRQGLLKLLAPETKDSNPPTFVPADVVSFQRVRFDGQKAIATIEKAIKDISPEFFGTYEFMLKNGGEALKQNDPDFDIRKNLFGNLGDDIITYAKAPRDTTLEAMSSPPMLTLIGSPAADKLAIALKAIMVLLSPDALTPKEREFLGRKIFTITAPAMPMSASTGPRGSLHYAASGGYLALSTDAAMLEEYLRSADTPPKGLRDTAGLAEAAQKVGGQNTGWFAYEQQAETMKLMFNLLKKAGADGGDSSGLDLLTGGLPIAGPDSSFKEWMDFSLLPEYDKVAKYFHFTVTSGAATKDGISFKVFGPIPPGLKK